MPQFDVSTFLPQLIWLGVFFGLLYGVMAWKILPRLNQIKSHRVSYWNGILQEAEECVLEAQQLEATVAATLKAVEQDEKISLDAALAALSAKLALKETAEQGRLRQAFLKARQQISQEKEKILEEAQPLLGPLSQDVCQRLRGLS